MSAPNLLNIYRKNEAESRALYEKLYHSPLAHHIDIPIQHLDALHSFPGFYYYTEEMTQLIMMIMEELRKLNDVTALLPKIANRSFQRHCLIEEIQSSNAIEGVRSTRQEISYAIDEQNNIKGANNIRLWSTVNKYLKLQSMKDISFSSSRDIREFYDGFLANEISHDDPKNLPDGMIFRKGTVDVWSKTKIIHHGVFPEEKIIRYMDIALGVLQEEQTPSLTRISLFHYLFGYIHPFYDGNGRMSRFITSYYLSKVLHPLVAIRLSITIKKSLRVYYKLFEDANHPGNYGDLTPFITGFLWLVQKSIVRVNEILQGKYNQMNTLWKNLKKLSDIRMEADKKIYFVLLQAYLFSGDGATLGEISETVQKNLKTVRSHIHQYPAERIVVNKSGKAYRFKLSGEFIEELQKLS